MDETGPDVPFTPTSYVNENPWNATEEEILWLLTPMELEVTPKGTILTSIMGNKKIVGHDYIDTDTRAGYLAYGLYEEQFNTMKEA